MSKTTITPRLSRREKEILLLVRDGLCNKEIAAKLCLSLNTIKNHRKNMHSKFDVHNAFELLRLNVSNF